MNLLFTLGEEFRFHHSSRFRKKAKMRKMLFWHFWVFSFSRADKAFEIFGVFEVFRLLCNLQYELLFWNFWGFLRILVRLCSQVPAKVQSALLLVACVTTLGGRRGGSPKTNNASKDQNKTEQCDAQSWQNDPLPTQTQKKASRQQCRSGISTSPTPCCESLRQQHPNNSKQHGALAKMGNMQAGLETFNQQPCSPGSCHSVGLVKGLRFVKAAPVFAKRSAAISFSRP